MRDDPVFNFLTVTVPAGTILLPAQGIISTFTVNQQDEEVDWVEVRHDGGKP